MVFGNKPGVMQILAATTNSTFASQTFGITTGTSNCDGSLMGGAGAKNIARGQGETLTNLAQAGCQDASAVGPSLQKRFDALFPAGAAASQVSESIVGALKGSPQLACSKLG